MGRGPTTKEIPRTQASGITGTGQLRLSRGTPTRSPRMKLPATTSASLVWRQKELGIGSAQGVGGREGRAALSIPLWGSIEQISTSSSPLGGFVAVFTYVTYIAIGWPHLGEKGEKAQTRCGSTSGRD